MKTNNSFAVFMALCGGLGLIAWASITSMSALGEEANAVSLFKDKKCAECHAWTAQGIGKPAKDKEEAEEGGKEPPDLSSLSDTVSGQADAVAFLKNFLKKKVEMNKKKHKKMFKGSDEELSTLVSFIVANAKKK